MSILSVVLSEAEEAHFVTWISWTDLLWPCVAEGNRYFRSAFPHAEPALCRRSQCGDRVIDVIIFRTDFRPSAFDRPVTGYLKDQIRSKLSIAGVATLTVVFRRGSRGELILDFDGPAEEISRAKTALEQE